MYVNLQYPKFSCQTNLEIAIALKQVVLFQRIQMFNLLLIILFEIKIPYMIQFQILITNFLKNPKIYIYIFHY